MEAVLTAEGTLSIIRCLIQVVNERVSGNPFYLKDSTGLQNFKSFIEEKVLGCCNDCEFAMSWSRGIQYILTSKMLCYLI